jgi:hypothetical protein
MRAAPPIPAPRSPAAHVVQQKAAIAPRQAVVRGQQVPAPTATAGRTSRPPGALQAKTAGRPGVIQRYNIGTIYERYLEQVKENVSPGKAILHDAQIVHDTLNNREKADIYFGFTNRWVKDRVETMGVTPMRALASIVGGHVEGNEGYPTKLSKLFEVTTGEFPFLATANKLKNRPFHDVSAGLSWRVRTFHAAPFRLGHVQVPVPLRNDGIAEELPGTPWSNVEFQACHPDS